LFDWFHHSRSEVLANHEFADNKKRKIVHKTVQAWIKEVEWPKGDQYVGDKYIKINHPKPWKITKRIGLATSFKTTGQYSGTPIQVTNYGLGGLCEAHIDPHGYIEGRELIENNQVKIN
jgi:hypothetical protein